MPSKCQRRWTNPYVKCGENLLNIFGSRKVVVVLLQQIVFRKCCVGARPNEKTLSESEEEAGRRSLKIARKRRGDDGEKCERTAENGERCQCNPAAAPPPPPLKGQDQTLCSVRPNVDNEIRKRKYRNGIMKSKKKVGAENHLYSTAEMKGNRATL